MSRIDDLLRGSSTQFFLCHETSQTIAHLLIDRGEQKSVKQSTMSI